MRCSPRLHLFIVAVFGAPVLAAGYLAATTPAPVLWQRLAILLLPWITIILGAVVVLVVVGYHARGKPVDFRQAIGVALGSVPRYVWTNCHSTVIFWLPVGLLLQARLWQETTIPLSGPTARAVDLGWWVVIGALAVTLHVRTMLAPTLALHENLPSTRAVIEAWRLSGRHFRLCLSTFVLACLPVALPLALVCLAALALLSETELASLRVAWAYLFLAGVQVLRPILVPSIYLLSEDLWDAEVLRRRYQGTPPEAGPARLLLALTRPLPQWGQWPGR